MGHTWRAQTKNWEFGTNVRWCKARVPHEPKCHGSIFQNIQEWACGNDTKGIWRWLAELGTAADRVCRQLIILSFHRRLTIKQTGTTMKKIVITEIPNFEGLISTKKKQAKSAVYGYQNWYFRNLELGARRMSTCTKAMSLEYKRYWYTRRLIKKENMLRKAS